MSERTFVFCDICNPQGTRYVEQRRGLARGPETGRRLTDGRAWFEGSIEEATATHGWAVASNGLHLCPECRRRNLKRDTTAVV